MFDVVESIYKYLQEKGVSGLEQVQGRHCILCYWFHPQYGCLESECDGVSKFYCDFELLRLASPDDPRLHIL